MNDRQAEALQRMLAASHPDDLVKVEAQPDGVKVEISGPGASPASALTANTSFTLTDDSVFLRKLVMNTLLGHAER